MYKLPAKFMEEENISIESDSEDINEKFSLNYFQNKTLENIGKKITSSVINTNERLNTTDVDIGNNKVSLNKIENAGDLIDIEKIYNLILENDYDNNNYNEIIENWFTIIVKNGEIYDLIEVFQEKITRKNLKLNFIFELSGFSLFYLFSILKINNKNIENAFKTYFFYLHQNFIVNVFLINKNYKLDNQDIGLIINENKSWMNKNNNLKCLINNNKMLKTIIKNILINFKALEIEEFSNLFSILINYIKNVKNFKLLTIKENIFKKVNLILLKFSLLIQT